MLKTSSETFSATSLSLAKLNLEDLDVGLLYEVSVGLDLDELFLDSFFYPNLACQSMPPLVGWLEYLVEMKSSSSSSSSSSALFPMSSCMAE